MPGILVCSLPPTVTNRQVHVRTVVTRNIENEQDNNIERIRETDATTPDVADTTPASIAQWAAQPDQNNINKSEHSNEGDTGNSRETPTATPTTTTSPAQTN
jgi:hypothetical protein